MKHEITCLRKISSIGKEDVFEYRDMYNDVKTARFPKLWNMTEDEVEEYLTTNDE